MLRVSDYTMSLECKSNKQLLTELIDFINEKTLNKVISNVKNVCFLT